jgi:hypothetical protein
MIENRRGRLLGSAVIFFYGNNSRVVFADEGTRPGIARAAL